MCLSIAIRNPDSVLATGYHEGYEYNVVHNNHGYRCGYIRVPKGHPWHGKDYDEITDPWPQVHGGLTFSQADEPCDRPGADDAWWHGFDCAHSGDAADPELPNALKRMFGGAGDVICTTQYVIAECKQLINQAIIAS